MRPRKPPLRGREEHIAQINANLQAVAHRGGSRVLLLKAGPGAGKTRLLVESMMLAAKSDLSVVSGLFAPMEAEGRHLRQDVEDGYAPHGGVQELHARVREAGAHGPVLVALDDLHLINISALTALRDLIASFQSVAALWMLAFDSEQFDRPRGPADLFAGNLSTEQMQELTALPDEALRELVMDHLGAIPDAAIMTLAKSVGDSTAAVIELIRALTVDGDILVTDGHASLQLPLPREVESAERIRIPSSVPAQFAVMIRRKLRALSPFTTKVLKLAAILGSPFTPANLAAMLDESPVDLLTALEEACGRGILVCRMSDFAFRSDPIWRVILDSVPPPMAVLLHKQAAAMLLAQPNGVEAAALHLVHVAQPGDVDAVRIISDAAARLVGSDPATAASLALRGMQLLRPEQDEYLRLATIAAEAFVWASDAERAIKVAADSLALAAELGYEQGQETGALRSWMSVALLLQGKVHEAGATARAVLTGGMTEVEAEHRERPELIRLAADHLTDDSAAAHYAEEILSSPEKHAPSVRAGALTVRAFERWRSGQVGETVRLLREAGAIGRDSWSVQVLVPQWVLCSVLTRVGEFEEAMSAASVGTAARTIPEPVAAAGLAVLEAPIHLARGHLDLAEEKAGAGIEAMDGLCSPLLAPPAWRVRILVALRRGLLAEADKLLREFERRFHRDSSRPWWAMRFLLSAQVAGARDGARAALDTLVEIWTSAGARRELVLEDPAAAAMCVRWALEAGAPDVATMVVGTVNALSAGNRNLHALGTGALHARGLLEGDPDALAQACQSHRDPWAQASAAEDRARLLLARDDREAAISDLEKALTGYSALGGERDSARVRGELRQLGVRRRHWQHAKRPVTGWDSLTDSERRVAELVANGLTNRQVASQLFVSPHTVGFHLRQVYRKLEVRSRMDLVRFKL